MTPVKAIRAGVRLYKNSVRKIITLIQFNSACLTSVASKHFAQSWRPLHYWIGNDANWDRITKRAGFWYKNIFQNFLNQSLLLPLKVFDHWFFFLLESVKIRNAWNRIFPLKFRLRKKRFKHFVFRMEKCKHTFLNKIMLEKAYTLFQGHQKAIFTTLLFNNMRNQPKTR